MSTRCWIGAETESGIKAVFVHSDGYPGIEPAKVDSCGVIPTLRDLVATHGIDKVVSTLLETSHPWDTFSDWTPEPEWTWYFTERYKIVPGFGVRFNMDSPGPQYFTPARAITWDVEYVYVIQADGKTVKWATKGVTKGNRAWRTQHWQEASLLPE
jgi:hypothetical protein